MSDEVTPWVESFRVRSYELTASGELGVPALCNYFQEAAGRHAGSMGFAIEDLVRESLTWVLARIDLVIDSLPRRGDEVEVETWPSRMQGLLAEREFLLKKDRRVLARATSAWFVIDLERRRPVRLPPRLRALRLPERDRALSKGLATIPKIAEPAWSRSFKVEVGDLDVNRHVNHVSYLRWAFESLPSEFHETHRLAELEVEFKTEVHYPAIVIAGAAPQQGNEVVLHRLELDGEGAEVARLRTRWAER